MSNVGLRFQDIDDRTEELRTLSEQHPDLWRDFLNKYELSLLYHENALEGIVVTHAELSSALRQARGGRVQLTAALVDADLRRAMYRAPLLEAEGDAAGPAGAAGSTARVSDHGDRHLQHLESATHEYSRRELRKKALHTGAAGWAYVL